MSNIKISIITICKNAEKTIEKTIKSINEQTYKNIEHIVIDGLSEDKTFEIVKKNKSRPGKIISEKDNGPNEANLKALKYFTGDIYFYLASDDFLSDKNIIKKVMDLFDPKTFIVYGNIEYYSHIKKKLTGRKFIPGQFKKNSYYQGWHAPFPAYFIRAEALKLHGFINETISVSDDFELMFRLQERFCLKSKYLNETITFVGHDGRSSTIKNIIIGNYNIIKTLRKHNKNLSISTYLYQRLFPKILDKIRLFFS